MKDQEFIAQLATFSNLEQLTNLNKSMGGLLEHQEFQMKQQKLAMAVSMIGKEVASTDGKRGIVSSVVMDGEDISLKVGKDSILLSKIREIRG
jgi:flagellar basal-body rod modification protein FlgD